MRLYFIVTTIFMISFATIFAQKPIFVMAKSESVNVYFSGVEMKQTAQVNLPVGTSDVVIKNVSNFVDENTIRVAVPATVTVLSAQFTNEFLAEYENIEVSPEIKKVKDSIEWLTAEIQKLDNGIFTDRKAIEMLDKNNQAYSFPQGLNVSEFEKMVAFFRSKRLELQTSMDTQLAQKKKKEQSVKELNATLNTNAQESEKISTGKIILQLMSETAIKANLSVTYISESAFWVPCYDFKVENVTQPAKLVYKAQVYQQTGVDWKKVKISLSNGNPSQNNQAPLLSAWFLRLGNPTVYSAREKKTSNLASNIYFSNDIGMLIEEDEPPIEMVTLADEANDAMRIVENKTTSNTAASFQRGISNFTKIKESQLNVNFDIDIPYDIISNGKVHTITLKEAQIPVAYRYYAVPKLDRSAFLMAAINNYYQYNLLPGTVNVIFEGMYTGKTFLSPDQLSDTLSISLGRDPKVVVKRENIADKSETKYLSSSKEQTFTYDIIVRNNKKEPISIVLKDQYPISSVSELEVTLLEKSNAIENKDLGVLTWMQEIPANATQKIRLSYKIKYPKTKNIINLGL